MLKSAENSPLLEKLIDEVMDNMNEIDLKLEKAMFEDEYKYFKQDNTRIIKKKIYDIQNNSENSDLESMSLSDSESTITDSSEHIQKPFSMPSGISHSIMPPAMPSGMPSAIDIFSTMEDDTYLQVNAKEVLKSYWEGDEDLEAAEEKIQELKKKSVYSTKPMFETIKKRIIPPVDQGLSFEEWFNILIERRKFLKTANPVDHHALMRLYGKRGFYLKYYEEKLPNMSKEHRKILEEMKQEYEEYRIKEEKIEEELNIREREQGLNQPKKSIKPNYKLRKLEHQLINQLKEEGKTAKQIRLELERVLDYPKKD